MSTYSKLKPSSNLLKGGIIKYTCATFCIIALAIFQDYIYSQLRHTGFYLSESLTYNTFWAFFVPIGFIVFQLLKIINPKNPIFKTMYLLGLGLVFSIIHILLFTSLFIIISNIFFNPPHRFIAILKSVVSNHFYIAFLFYAFAPYLYFKYLDRNKKVTIQDKLYSDKFNIKIGTSIKTIETSSIQLITTDKPYTIIYADSEKFLQDKPLKSYEMELDPTLFLRVHRSAIINKEYVTELKSRKNGDYDAILTNGQSVRLSRHFRNNWVVLLH